jgi:hypothetical protein
LHIFFVSTSQAADFRTRLSCATDHPTTSYALIETKDHFELQILHHNGVQYMPIHQGLITIADLQTFQKDAELFVQMGVAFSVNFLKTECQETGEDWACVKKQPTQLGKLAVKSMSFAISDKQVITKKYSAKYKIAQITFVEGFYSRTLPMEYSPANCRFYP